jgi:cholesterol transport system auxiliary component
MSGKVGLLAASTALVMAACSIGRPIPEVTTYIVEPPAELAAASEPRRLDTLRMGNVRVAAPFAGSGLVYRLDDVRYTSDPYHAFVADPGAMLGNQMAEWLEQAGPFSTVDQPGSTRPARYVLEATVAELYGDFRQDRPPAAVLAVQFALIDQVGARPKVVYERTIASRVKLPKASPDALVRGYGTALAEILSQVAPELSTQVARR